MVGVVQYILILSLLCLAGCSRIDLHLAENAYAEAKATKQAKPIIAALNTLTMLAPEVYQAKLNSAQMAVINLQRAKSYIAKNNYYLAFIASHESYRALPTIKSKKILIKTGVKIRYLLDAQAGIVKSFQNLPKSIPALLSKYENKPALEWDLIEVNSVIEQLVSATKAMNSSLKIIEGEQGANLSVEIKKWQLAIQNQLQMINDIQKYLIHLALYKSANVLEDMNNKLTQETVNLLSLVRESLAEAAMRPNFIKANEAYQPYYHLNENLALASSSSRGNSHAVWYQHWHSLELQVLAMSSSFSQYPLAFTERAKQLKLYKAKLVLPNMSNGFLKLSLFIGKHQAVYSLIDKLHRDRMILNYGESSV
ncbi:hypothetical protein [Colwellia piezophila]|uniref:hypothetical protein n=1 Tax=Colwellia piezophila TaxID=211668 RepID=UPI0003663AFF|nr:hypothetical protein [Colwellia piezophila]